MRDAEKVGKTCKRCNTIVRMRAADNGTLDDGRSEPYAACRCDSIDGPDVD